MIALIAYGAGNIRSVSSALDFIGADYRIATSGRELAGADKIILPGVGASRAGMKLLEAGGFRDVLDEEVLANKKPLLGICLGMQLIAETGTEFGEHTGLGYVPGRVELIPRTSEDIRLPHIGWNQVDVLSDCPLLKGLEEDRYFYFVHSFQLLPSDPALVSGVCTVGEAHVTASITGGHIFGTQFHPEKSQNAGLTVLRNFDAI